MKSGIQPTTLHDVTKMPFERLALRGDWAQFIGSVPAREQWTALISGPSGTGKSSFCLSLAKELSRFGQVLYVAAEERLKSGTIRIRARLMHVTSRRIWIHDTTSINDVTAELDTGAYAYCLIDSVQELQAPGEETLALKERYPNVSFIFVAQADAAEKRSVGGHKVRHMVDIRIWTEADDDGSRWATNIKNRYAPTMNRFHLYTPPQHTANAQKAHKSDYNELKNRIANKGARLWKSGSS